MAYKQIKFTDELRKEIKIGIDAMAEAVKITLGPMGKNVIIQNPGALPHVTKDGVTVAGSINLENAYQNLGCQLIIDAAHRTVKDAGDGTTTVTVLTQHMMSLLFDSIKQHKNTRQICEGMNLALAAIKKIISDNKRDINDNKQLQYVATVSANNDETVGKLIFEIFEKIGKDGLIFTDASKSSETYHEFTDGIKFYSGFPSHHFVTSVEENAAILEDAKVLIISEKVNSMHDLLPLIKKIQAVPDDASKPLFIMARGFESDVISSLLANKAQGKMKVCIVEAPTHVHNPTQFMEDIAIMTGAKVLGIQHNLPLLSASTTCLGSAGKIKVRADHTVIMQPGGDEKEIETLITQITNEIANEKSSYMVEDLKRRLGKLRGSIAILYIGAASDSELVQKKDRIDDAIAAVQASLDEGVIMSTASFLLRAVEEINENKPEFKTSTVEEGFDVVIKSLKSVFYQVMRNANLEPLPVHDRMKNIWKLSKDTSYSFGYNIMTEEITNLIDGGIIDPAKVLRCALENSISVSTMMISTDCAIVNVDEDL